MFLERNIKPNSVGFLVIYDTINSKNDAKRIQGPNYHFSHAGGKSVWSYCVVTSNFETGDISTPISFRPYYRKEQCESINKPFKVRCSYLNNL